MTLDFYFPALFPPTNCWTYMTFRGLYVVRNENGMIESDVKRLWL